jgi:hypothetical protein
MDVALGEPELIELEVDADDEQAATARPRPIRAGRVRA